jgi:hypothetical protein
MGGLQNDVLRNTWNMDARATGHTSSVAGDLKDALSQNGKMGSDPYCY